MNWAQVFGSVSANLIVLIVTIAVRLFWLRPKLELNPCIFMADTPTIFEDADSLGERYDLVLKVRNKGLQKMNNPKAFCLAFFKKDDTFKISSAPFEIPWYTGDKDFDIGFIFPGPPYELRFAFLDNVVDRKSKSEISTKLVLSKRDNNPIEHEVLPGMPYEIYLVIGNDNLLVPSYYCHLKLSWNPGQSSPLSSEILSDGDLWRHWYGGKVKIEETSQIRQLISNWETKPSTV